MSARLRRVISSGDSGASAVEYGLLVAGIAALIVGIVFAFGGFISGIFDDTCENIVSESGGTIGPNCETTPGGGPDDPDGAAADT